MLLMSCFVVQEIWDSILTIRQIILLCMRGYRRQQLLAYLEAIHNFVEVLNEYFHNVCELDLVFNFYKVSLLLGE